MVSRNAKFIGSGLLVAALLTGGCKTNDPDYCQKAGDCPGGRVCNVASSTCVVPDASLGTLDGTAGSGGTDAPNDVAEDVSYPNEASGTPVDGSLSAEVSEAGRPVDTRGVDSPGPEVGTLDAARLDAIAAVDGAGTCGVSGDCTDPSRAFCVAGMCMGCQTAGATACGTLVCDGVSGRCVECAADTQCTKNAAKAFCVANACTGCDATGATGCSARTDGKILCSTTGTAAGQCVECATDSQCTKDPAKGFCVANACTGCATTGATGCASRTDGNTVCATSGTAAGQCVACVADAQCTADPTKGFCVANVCMGCNTTGATGCGARTDGKTVCSTSGTSSGQCVECAADSQCTSNPAKGFCVANACTGCNAAGATGCAARTDSKTVCATSGTASGQCVECIADTQCTASATKGFCVANACAGCQAAAASACSVRSAATPVCGTTGICVQCNTSTDCTVTTKPICTSNVCGQCTADSQCIAKLGATGNPGVCLSNIDGRCAMDTETVYVQNVTGCSTTTVGGTSATPFCSTQAGVANAKTNSKPLVVITGTLAAASTTVAVTAPLTIVGKSSAKLLPAAGGDGIDITSGEIYLRGITVQGSASTGMGINAAPTSGNTVTLHMDTCAVINNSSGGILLNGAAFDIENTTVTGNGPGTLGAVSWGGILVNALPTSGLVTLNLVTVQNNNGGGLSCAGAITGAGVWATGNTNTVSQIGTTCGVASCSTSDASATCGAQSTP